MGILYTWYDEKGDYHFAPEEEVTFKTKAIFSGIYKITSPTGKVYIGQSRDILKRWRGYWYHNCKAQPQLYNSLKKYGSEKHKFTIDIRLSKQDNQNIYDYYEIKSIEYYIKKGAVLLNLTTGGRECKFSAESRKKLSRKTKENWETGMYDFRRDLRGDKNPSFGIKRTDAQRAAQSERLKIKFKELNEKKSADKKAKSELYWGVTRRAKNLETFAIPVVQLTMSGDYIREWECINYAEKECRVSHKTIKIICEGGKTIRQKFNWMYKKDYEHKINNSNNGR